MTDFASVKLRKKFAQWLKLRAAEEGVPMYKLVENLVFKGKHRPVLDR